MTNYKPRKNARFLFLLVSLFSLLSIILASCSNASPAATQAVQTAIPLATQLSGQANQLATQALGNVGPLATQIAGQANPLLGTAQAALPNTGAPLLKVANNSQLGDILVDNQGMTLYTFKKDTANNSTCYNTCAQTWPPYTIKTASTTVGQGVNGTVGVITRTDGTVQMTYNGMPLYYYVKDVKPGDANGQGIGNVWYVVKP